MPATRTPANTPMRIAPSFVSTCSIVLPGPFTGNWRDVASVSGYGYTAALQAAGGQWTYDRLDAYLKNSQEYIPGTAMVQRFPQDDRRADILAYLATLSDNPAPFPAPAVVHAEADAHMEDAAGMVEEAAAHAEDAAGAVVDAAHDVNDAVEDAADAVEDVVDHE